ncbi:glycerol-3-phosphate 1-O-acyltransferase PlsY [candidate division KSB1 bacterium]|nr:glycerol-3-phosphate 1-O-acyltransferase PlsY [candidate division KSB1 bacterium]
MLSFVTVVIVSYLVGSIPTSIIVGKILRGTDFDIRKEGSGNAGGTNVFRVLGWKPGIFVMAFDALKGFAATLWISHWQPFGPSHIDESVLPIICGIAAVVGHIWTIFAGFRGGKGVGTAAGMIVALYPIAALICFAVFVGVVYLTRYISLGSMTAATCLPIVLLLGEKIFRQEVPDAMFQFSLALTVLIFYTHRQNIRRLLAGTENRFGQKRNVSA